MHKNAPKIYIRTSGLIRQWSDWQSGRMIGRLSGLISEPLLYSFVGIIIHKYGCTHVHVCTITLGSIRIWDVRVWLHVRDTVKVSPILTRGTRSAIGALDGPI